MFLENQVIGDDFVEKKDWAKQSMGVPTDLGNPEFSIDNLTYGLTRIVRALSKSIFGQANPEKNEINIPSSGSPNINELIAKISALETKMANIETKVNEIHTAVSTSIPNSIATLQNDLKGVVKNFTEAASLKDQLDSIEGKIKTPPTTDAIAGAVNTKLSENTSSLFAKINDAVKKAVIFITGNTGYPYTGGGTEPKNKLFDIMKVLNTLKSNKDVVYGKLSGGLKSSSPLNPTTTFTFDDNAKIAIGTDPNLQGEPRKGIPFISTAGDNLVP